jgi:trans-aconitate methyltransferase
VCYACTKVFFDQEAVVFVSLSTGAKPQQVVLTTQQMQRFLAVYQEESTRTVPLAADSQEEHP